MTVTDLKSIAREHGSHFFDRNTMRFFNSRVCRRVVRTDDGGAAFVTSEKFDENSPRLFTARRMRPDGKVDTIGDFQGHRTAASAWKAALAS